MRFLTAAMIVGISVGSAMGANPASDAEVAKVVADHIRLALPAKGPGGIAVAVRIGGRNLFFNFGLADTRPRQSVTSDHLFNLGSITKTFDATLLAQAALQRELSLDDPVATYVTELKGR